MPEPRLYDALELTKQGKRKQAILLVREILRDDSHNLAAWWLMANLLDDEDKVLKCLQHVLQINPEHRGARKKLATLRPDLGENLPPLEEHRPEKIEAIPEKELVETTPPQYHHNDKVESNFLSPILAMISIRKIAIALVMIVILFGFIAVILSRSNQQSTIFDDNGNTPQQVTEVFIRAMWLEDVEILYRLSCSEYHNEVDAIVADFSGYDYSQWTVDTSQTHFDLFYVSGEQAYVTMKGTIIMTDGGQSYSVNWDEEANREGYEGYGEYLSMIDGTWRICVSFDVK